ncbi:MAG: LexA family transcriptional regulator [Oscillospiraceae bacterium]|nr:LexA family transcriptional regulator [Oscillospiraceae bacterium]
MDNRFGRRLAAARKETGLNQTEVAARLTAAGFPVRTQAVSKWERGTTLPSAVQLVELCRLYGIRDVVSAFAPAAEKRSPARVLPLYHLAVSAGTGEFLDGADYDTVEAGEEISPEADFGVRIAGDSMEPRFVHGQIVWVKRQETLRSGEIGIFLLNGAGYCKRLERAGGRVELRSLNPLYPPIRVGRGDELRIFGKVVG